MEMILKCCMKKNVIYRLIHIDLIQIDHIGCALVCLSDLQLSREILPVFESQCELISIYRK